MALSADDRRHLRRALALAERGRRTAAPNPVVGALVVAGGAVVGEGWHERPGALHAEVAALAAAGERARGATVYTSLEPCTFHGRTPPCTEALLAAGVRRVVVGALDPNPLVDGRGVAGLRAGGVDVEVAAGALERDARRQNAAFRTLVRLGRPHVTLKAAVSLDGRTATAAGESHWISSPQSRRLVHEWRAQSAAVGVGSGTALADDPLLTARDVVPPAERQPLRVVFDRRARLSPGSRLVRSLDEAPLLVFCDRDAPGRAALEAAGVETAATAGLEEALRELGRRERSSLLVEGGARLGAALQRAGLVDRVALFVAPLLLGDEAPGLLAGFTAGALVEAPRAPAVRTRRIGPDALLVADLREA